MDPEHDAPAYLLWGADNVVYGPVDLPTLVNWVQEERVTADSWVHLRHLNAWQKAGQMSELQMFYHERPAPSRTPATLTTTDGRSVNLKPGSLRRVRILASMSDEQLQQFAGFMDILRVRQWEEIVKEGSPGDAMYLLLDGEVRVRLMIAGKETILATLCSGEFFGEVALFDHGPRSADVIANKECLLLRVPAGAFQKLIEQVPSLAAPFLFAVSRTLIARIRADNKRYRDSIAFARTAHQ
jgi:CRP-like cAMP-binding protein